MLSFTKKKNRLLPQKFINLKDNDKKEFQTIGKYINKKNPVLNAIFFPLLNAKKIPLLNAIFFYSNSNDQTHADGKSLYQF